MPIRKRTASAAAFILLRGGLPIANPISEISCILQNHAVTRRALRELFAPNYFSHVFRPLSFVTFSRNWLEEALVPLAITWSTFCSTQW